MNSILSILTNEGRGSGSNVTPNDNGRHRNNPGRGRKRQVFEPYMAPQDVSEGLKRSELLQGPLRINPKKYHEAFLPSPVSNGCKLFSILS
ncbi:UNVERIFIED_CONTAM: hypothetical protein FKN15_010037 [Acipenser sinensis]